MTKTKIDPLLDHFSSRRTVFLTGELTSDSLAQLMRQMILLRIESAEPIKMVIDSGGGDTIASLAFCDFLRFGLEVPVHGIVTGICGSAATFILLHCTKRYGMPHSLYLIHSSEAGGLALKTSPSTKHERKQLDLELDSLHDKVTQMYMRTLKLKRKKVEELTDRGEQRFNREMWAEEALELGLITEIITQPLRLFD